jgi:hypothetical protein
MNNKPKYSGNASTSFWRKISALDVSDTEHQELQEELYRLGTILQNIEEYVLSRLAKAEQRKR